MTMGRSLLLMAALAAYVAVSLAQPVPQQCICRNVRLPWCGGPTCRHQPRTTTQLRQCGRLVFDNEEAEAYTIRVWTWGVRRRLIQTVDIRPRVGFTHIARFDEAGTYYLEVTGERGRRLVRVTSMRKLPACRNVVGHCVDADGSRYNLNQQWAPRACKDCQCVRHATNSQLSVRCRINPCGAKTCLGGYQPSVVPGECCPECPKVCWNSETVSYVRAGYIWSEPCHTCHCSRSGEKNCSYVECPLPPSCPGDQQPLIIRALNPCCPLYQCPVTCEVFGRVYEDGRTWTVGCLDYVCQNGRVFTSATPCPSRRCYDALGTRIRDVIPDGECCGVCPSCRIANGTMTVPPGARFRRACESCECLVSGEIRCNPDVCPTPPPCPGGQIPHVAGQSGCCDTYTCPPACQDRGQNYTEGATWNHGGCMQCRCQRAAVVCSSPPCAPLTCPEGQDAVRRAGQCCPTVCQQLCPWQCGEQLYKVVLESTFSEHHQYRYPLGGFLGSLFLVAHEHNYFLWAENENASPGFARFLRNRVSSGLTEEMSHSADAIKTVKMIWSGSGTTNLISIGHRHAILSGAGGIYPSPDWFYGLNTINLCDAIIGRWRNVTVDLFPYDLGFNSATRYAASIPDSRRQQPIYKIEPRRFQRESREFYRRRTSRRVNPVGTLQLQLLSDGCRDFEAISTVTEKPIILIPPP